MSYPTTGKGTAQLEDYDLCSSLNKCLHAKTDGCASISADDTGRIFRNYHSFDQRTLREVMESFHLPLSYLNGSELFAGCYSRSSSLELAGNASPTCHGQYHSTDVPIHAEMVF
jgi:hypothetical protein